MADPQEITALLKRSGAGDETALASLMPLVYDELRMIARAQRRRAPDQTLDTTALVHEAYLRLLDRDRLDCADRRHFFAYVAKAMRSILLDGARRRAAVKRGGDLVRDDDALIAELPQLGSDVDLIAIDAALGALARLSPRLAEVVELHVFAGLEFSEIAECLGVTERTVFRDWRKARALLGQQLGAG
jgi:RNA polymerase sigma factor (TIGR02999 family)